MMFVWLCGILTGIGLALLAEKMEGKLQASKFWRRWAGIVQPDHVETRQLRRQYARGVARGMIRQARLEHQKR